MELFTHLALIVSIIFGLIYVLVTPGPAETQLTRFCGLSKWLSLISFGAFWLSK